MADIFTKKKRSDVMSLIRGRKNRSTEQVFVKFLRKSRITGWRRNYGIFGSPDIAFPRHKIAIFLDGCFWHGCPKHGTFPKTNRKFWRNKIEMNIKRDRLVNKTLKKDGWKVMRVWEHDLKNALF